MIADALERHRSVIWIDAGSTVTAPLRTTLFPIIRANRHLTFQAGNLGQVRGRDGWWAVAASICVRLHGVSCCRRVAALLTRPPH